MDRYIQALSLEMSIMERLLERHRCSHGRAIYFRRISMVVQAARKHNLRQLGDRVESLEKAAVEYCQHRKRKRTEDHWDLRRGILTDEQRPIHEHFEASRLLLTYGFTELLSRIDHASSMLFLEVSRGFFLPFCTVALALLARIRTILLRIGWIGLSKLQSMLTAEETLRKFLSIEKARVDTCMTQYLKEDQEPVKKGIGIGRVSNDERRAALVQSLGFTLSKTRGTYDDVLTSGLFSESTDNAEDLELDTGIQRDINVSGAISVATPTLRASTDDNDIGECVMFSSVTDMNPVVIQSKASLREAYRMADTMDRNMEIVENLKGGMKRGSSHGKNTSSSQNVPKRSKEEEKGTKKKKKRSKGDFFDTLFK